MDEPTSSMDAQSEVMFLRQLREAAGTRTLVMVTHRPAVLELVDRVIVVDGGKVVLDGPKAAVLAALSGVRPAGAAARLTDQPGSAGHARHGSGRRPPPDGSVRPRSSCPFMKTPDRRWPCRSTGPPRRGDDAFMSGVRAAQVVEADAARRVGAVPDGRRARRGARPGPACPRRRGHQGRRPRRAGRARAGHRQPRRRHPARRCSCAKAAGGRGPGAGRARPDALRGAAERGRGQAHRAEGARSRACAPNPPAVRSSFPPDVLAVRRASRRARSDSYAARKRALDEAVGSNQRGMAMLRRELSVSEAMSAKGLLSEIEVLHLRRQINDLSLQMPGSHQPLPPGRQHRAGRLQTELARSRSSRPAGATCCSRTVIKSPVHGLVKNIRINTLGGVVAAGAPIMEIVPHRPSAADRGAREAGRHRLPAGRARPPRSSSPPTTSPSTAALDGQIESISPDAMGDTEHATGSADPTYYRVHAARRQQRAAREGQAAAGAAGHDRHRRGAHRRALGAQLPAAADDQVQGSVPRALIMKTRHIPSNWAACAMLALAIAAAAWAPAEAAQRTRAAPATAAAVPSSNNRCISDASADPQAAPAFKTVSPGASGGSPPADANLPRANLLTLVRAAIQRSNAVGAARLLAEAAAVDIDGAHAAYYPQVNVSGQVGGLVGGAVGSASEKGGNYQAGANVTAPLFDGGRSPS